MQIERMKRDLFHPLDDGATVNHLLNEPVSGTDIITVIVLSLVERCLKAAQQVWRMLRLPNSSCVVDHAILSIVLYCHCVTQPCL